MMQFFGDTRAQLMQLGLPGGDAPTDDTSSRRFEDDCHFRIEVPTVNSAAAAEYLLSESRRRGFTINRITETRGMSRHTHAEIAEYAAIGKAYGAEVLMSVGPRASYDTGASVHTVEGARIGYRLRGQEQVVRAIEDIKRAIELGIRGFVVYDEGLLWVLGRLREARHLPDDLHFKVSAHCGHCNPSSARLLEILGADSINPVRDLTLPIIAAIRKSVTLPLDCHVDNPKSSGGFIRTYEAPEFVRVAAPVYLKTGNSALEGHGGNARREQLDEMLQQIEIVSEFLQRHYPQAKQSAAGARSARADFKVVGVS
jgi:hypothetical protein